MCAHSYMQRKRHTEMVSEENTDQSAFSPEKFFVGILLRSFFHTGFCYEFSEFNFWYLISFKLILLSACQMLLCLSIEDENSSILKTLGKFDILSAKINKFDGYSKPKDDSSIHLPNFIRWLLRLNCIWRRIWQYVANGYQQAVPNKSIHHN